jgi:hypothetical protein
MKVAVRVIVGLVLLFLLAGLGAVLFIDSLAKKAVERGGTHALGVETRLADASIGLRSGRFALSGLTVANPPGFERPEFLTLGATELELPLGTLLEDRITIPSLLLEGITLDLERNAQGTNYGVILDNLKRFEGEAPAPDESPEEGKKFVLQRLVIRDVRAFVNLLPAGGELTKLELSIPEVVVEDLGNEMTLGQICALVVKTLIQAAIQQGGLPDQLLADLRGRLGELEETARVKVEGEIGKLEEELGAEAKKLGPEAEKAVENAADKAREAFGGLLKKKKD